MREKQSPILSIIFLFFLFMLVTVPIGLLKTYNQTRPGETFFFSFDSALPSPLSHSAPATKKTVIQKQFIRSFRWEDPEKKQCITDFHIPESSLKKEIRKFGSIRLSTHPLLLKRSGFRVVGRKSIWYDQRLKERIVSIIDYEQIYKRNLKYFASLTGELMESCKINKDKDPLYYFLRFVQFIPYKIPPPRYRGKFINSFFVPLVCLYEQYGDCDSKAILLAEFLATFPDSEEKIAIVLIRGQGIAHAVLAVKRKPLFGQTSLHDFKRGYYIVLETTSPGWSPGFISRRVTDAIKSGYFQILDLN
jgi:hypothetical protein